MNFSEIKDDVFKNSISLTSINIPNSIGTITDVLKNKINSYKKEILSVLTGIVVLCGASVSNAAPHITDVNHINGTNISIVSVNSENQESLSSDSKKLVYMTGKADANIRISDVYDIMSNNDGTFSCKVAVQNLKENKISEVVNRIDERTPYINSNGVRCVDIAITVDGDVRFANNPVQQELMAGRLCKLLALKQLKDGAKISDGARITLNSSQVISNGNGTYSSIITVGGISEVQNMAKLSNSKPIEIGYEGIFTSDVGNSSIISSPQYIEDLESFSKLSGKDNSAEIQSVKEAEKENRIISGLLVMTERTNLSAEKLFGMMDVDGNIQYNDVIKDGNISSQSLITDRIKENQKMVLSSEAIQNLNAVLQSTIGNQQNVGFKMCSYSGKTVIHQKINENAYFNDVIEYGRKQQTNSMNIPYGTSMRSAFLAQTMHKAHMAAEYIGAKVGSGQWNESQGNSELMKITNAYRWVAMERGEAGAGLGVLPSLKATYESANYGQVEFRTHAQQNQQRPGPHHQKSQGHHFKRYDSNTRY